MEKYNYRVYKSVYDDMVSGNKTIEIRLLNEKSEKIKPGDQIDFKVLDSDEFVSVEVVSKYIFNDVDELYLNKDKYLSSAKGYTKEELTNILYQIFGKEAVDSSKLVGIEFKLLEDVYGKKKKNKLK